jgi:hypothetical protein
MMVVGSGEVEIPVSPPGEEVAVYDNAPETGETVTVADEEDVAEALRMVGIARGIIVDDEEGDEVKFALVL